MPCMVWILRNTRMEKSNMKKSMMYDYQLIYSIMSHSSISSLRVRGNLNRIWPLIVLGTAVLDLRTNHSLAIQIK